MPTKAKTAQPKTKAKDDKTAKKATEAKDPKATKKAEVAKDTKKPVAPKVDKATKDTKKDKVSKVDKAAKDTKKAEAPKKVDKDTKKAEASKVDKDLKKHEAPEAPKKVDKDTKKTEAPKPPEPPPELPKIPRQIPKPPGEPGALEKRLSHAIEILGTGKADEAYKLFGGIAEDAMGSGDFGLARVARCYLVHKQNLETVPPEADPIQETVFLLNAKKPEAVLERIETMVKTKNASAHAYYLKALAHASAHQLDLSAQSLKQAIELDPALLNIYRLEPDFKACRRSPLFADFELA